MGTKNQFAVAVCAFELGKTAPHEIQLTPTGLFKARDGRPHGLPGWFIDADIARGVIDRAAANVDRFLIDYEHQTLYTKENGQKAPAAGWGPNSRMEWREGEGLFLVDVEWTEAAKTAIDNKEYLYISPVIAYDPKTGHVLAIVMAAMVNYAAIDGMDGMAELAAAKFSFEQPHQKENVMNEALRILLGIDKDASDEDINKAVTALKTKLDAASASEETIATLKAKVDSPDPAKFVPVETMTKLQKQVAALSTRLNDSEVDDLVVTALADGKLMPAQEEWARNLGTKDVAELKAYLDNAAPIAALKGSQTQGKKPEGENAEGELSTDELAVCKATGVDVEEFKKTKLASAEQAAS